MARQVCLKPADWETGNSGSRAAYADEHIIITKRGKPFVALISAKDLAFLEKIKAGPPEDGLLGAVGMEPALEELAEKTMEGYQRRTDDFGER